MDLNTRKVVCGGTTLRTELQSITTFRDVLAKNRNERANERAIEMRELF